MAIFETIGNFFGTFWGVATDFFLLLFVIIYAILFFVIQWYLIKAYIWLGSAVYDGIPKIKDFFLLRLGTSRPEPSPVINNYDNEKEEKKVY